MKQQIKDIISLQNEISNYDNLIFEKENDILSCIKSSSEEGIKLRQKQAASSLLDLQNKQKKLKSKLRVLLKGLDSTSYQNKKMSSDLVTKCIWSGIFGEPFNQLKKLYKSL